ncbi:superoxide dismutase [Cu-Zn] SodC [Candidatus Sororendozoicomonas aggregata]|uniref:superoxide dismutase [Cu-Zn] SodC n=1 Tax=Candidatus Sororendozoicomonas aggregata TaxID=3073239 RepID=UPI002ED192BC
MKPRGMAVIATALFLLLSGCAKHSVTVKMHKVSDTGEGADMGDIIITPTKKGVQFQVDLKGFTPGEHGFHIHQNPSCAAGEKEGKLVAALAADGHFDPHHTKKHAGPYGNGHLGDLPRLIANDKGEIHMAVIAPRLTMKDLKGHSLMIHMGGDNYTDTPPMGGGGARVSCGVMN